MNPSQLIAKFTTWFDERPQAEKVVLAVIGIGGVLYLYLTMIFDPIRAEISGMERQIETGNTRIIEQQTRAEELRLSGVADPDAFVRARLEAIIQEQAEAQTGIEALALDGRMLFARAAAPDGPYASLEIGTLPTDNDNVTIDPGRYGLTATGVRNMNLDNGSNEATGYTRYRIGAAHEFRYGRMIVNNAYGPETEDLALTFDVEYYNGSEFVRNTLDNCSVINAAELSFNSYTVDLGSGETTITIPDTATLSAGQTQSVTVSSAPLETSAPGEGNTGTVNIELDLSAATGLNMEYLQFEWDDVGADYNENPQGQIEFGQYRMHDRIINWQEVYNTATP